MKQKISRLSKFIVCFFSIIILSKASFSAVLELQKIGALDTTGNTYPEWWYTGSSPVLSGVAEVGTAVSIIIDENTYSSTPDASGVWAYTTEIEDGDYDISISQGGNTISFVLHLGQTMPANTGTTSGTEPGPSEVPETGFNQYVAMSFGLGIILLSTYFYFSIDSNKKKVFESRMLKED